MARFYKATPGNYVENKMFQLDPAVMFKAIDTIDQNITDVYDKIDKEKELLDVKRMSEDDPIVRERLGGYESAIDKIAESMDSDILGYKKHAGTMRDVSRNISSDLKTGILGTAQKNFETFDKYKTELEKNKKIGQERKDLLERAVKKRYGGLGPEGSDATKDISEYLITGLEDFNETDYLNKIQQGWEADQTSRAWYGDESSGTERTRFRSEDEIARYIESDLENSGWGAQQRQMYELQEELGELPEGEDVESMMGKAKANLINKAKDKLGYKQVTKTVGGGSGRGKTTDPGKQNIEVRNNIPTQGERKALEDAEEKFYNLHKNKVIEGDFNYYYNAAFSPNSKVTFTEAFRELQDKGYFKGKAGKEEFIDLLQNKKRQNTDYHPVTDQAVINTYNNRSINENVRGIYVISSDGSRIDTGYNNASQMVEDRSKNHYYLPPSQVKSQDWNRVNGYLASADGTILKNTQDQPIKDISEYDPNINKGKKPKLLTTVKNTYAGGENPIQTKLGQLKYKEDVVLNLRGESTVIGSYVDTQNTLRVNSETGEVEFLNVEIEMTPESIGRKSNKDL